MSQAIACANNDCDKIAQELVKHLSDGKVLAYCHVCADREVLLGAERAGNL